METVKTRIIDHIITTCGAISADQIIDTDGNPRYNRTVKTAQRVAAALNEIKAYDVVFVERTRERKRLLCANVAQTLMTVWLWGLVQARDTTRELDNLAADIEKALMVDETRGGLAISTRVVSTEETTVEEVLSVGAILLEIEVLFQHLDGNPYTAVGS